MPSQPQAQALQYLRYAKLWPCAAQLALTAAALDTARQACCADRPCAPGRLVPCTVMTVDEASALLSTVTTVLALPSLLRSAADRSASATATIWGPRGLPEVPRRCLRPMPLNRLRRAYAGPGRKLDWQRCNGLVPVAKAAAACMAGDCGAADAHCFGSDRKPSNEQPRPAGFGSEGSQLCSSWAGKTVEQACAQCMKSFWGQGSRDARARPVLLDRQFSCDAGLFCSALLGPVFLKETLLDQALIYTGQQCQGSVNLPSPVRLRIGCRQANPRHAVAGIGHQACSGSPGGSSLPSSPLQKGSSTAPTPGLLALPRQ